eukprot:8075909-Heterocapsa_arctica.AAC.1
MVKGLAVVWSRRAAALARRARYTGRSSFDRSLASRCCSAAEPDEGVLERDAAPRSPAGAGGELCAPPFEPLLAWGPCLALELAAETGARLVAGLGWFLSMTA